MTTMAGKHYLLKQNKPFFLVVLSLILARENAVFVWRWIGRAATGFYMNHQCVRVISLVLANTNIQYKQINYDADNIDNNK